MAEARKRVPWWLIVCTAILVPLAAVVGLIETVGRQGTLVGRLEQVPDTRSRGWIPEHEFLRIMGPPSETSLGTLPRICGATWGVHYRWRDGPASLEVFSSRLRSDLGMATEVVATRDFEDEDGHIALDRHVVVWRIRRWAEDAYTAIHGARR